MCEYSSDDGFASDWHLVHLGSRAVGGAGLVMAEATAVEADGRITYGDHGYLAHEFLSPLSNFRKDQYGGSFANRARLALEITEAVRGEMKYDQPLFMRISCTDWAEGGWTIEDSVELAKLVKPLGVDL